MRRRRRRGHGCGVFFLMAGILVLLGLIMPAGFWWFALAVVLICVGIWLMRCC